MPIPIRIFLAAIVCLITFGCRSKYREDIDYSYEVQQIWTVEELGDRQMIQFESVFWEPDDTISLRNKLFEERIAAGRSVLEIGTGTGLISILAADCEATRVVATDINPAAVACAKYNAANLNLDSKLEVRTVPKDSPDAFSVIDSGERFDLILSNPPWEDGEVSEPSEHAFYDPSFALMDSLLDGLPVHLNPGGRCLLAYGHVPALVRLESEAIKRGYTYKKLDDRELKDLPKDFLPGMLVEIRVTPEIPKSEIKKLKNEVSANRKSENGTTAKKALPEPKPAK